MGAAMQSGNDSVSSGSVPASAAAPPDEHRAGIPTRPDVAQRSASPQPAPATASSGDDPVPEDAAVIVHVAAEMLELASLAQKNAAISGARQESGPQCSDWLGVIAARGDLPSALRLLRTQ